MIPTGVAHDEPGSDVTLSASLPLTLGVKGSRSRFGLTSPWSTMPMAAGDIFDAPGEAASRPRGCRPASW